ncbi:MAG: PQQ-binding-like beta-propeller repeat protein, partial [Planctomycetota bacterium]|nr:PQQ-binding-like beta-propeller repeat protein [Planctomycetota bacterium]
MKLRRFFVSLILLVLFQQISFADWPEYRGNLQRTGFHPQNLKARSWKPAWAKQFAAPQSAWDSPARGSLWQNLTSIEARVTDDRANVPLIATDLAGKMHVVVPSSTEDRLVALDPLTGNINWQVETDGPIRFAPSLAGGAAYFGADDGYLRAVDLRNGKILWQELIGPGYPSIVGNGRLISPHPIRTSVLVNGDYVFAHAGLFPSQGVYSVAVHRKTGKLIWRRQTSGSPQGYLLATGDDRLYIPTGRSSPYAIDSTNGKKLYDLPSPGGTFCMLTPHMFFSGPGNSPEVQSFAANNNAKMLAFKARQVAAGNGKIWTANGSRIACHDLTQVAKKLQKTLWQLESKHQNGLMVSGNPARQLLFAGGSEGVDFVDARTGKLIQKIAVEKSRGEVVHLAITESGKGVPETLVASTNTGWILAWQLANQLASRSQPHSLLDRVPERPSAAAVVENAELTLAISKLKSPRGFALVVGNRLQSTLDQIVKQTSLHVVGVVDTPRTASQLKTLFRDKGLYGTRVSIRSHTPGQPLPITSGIFNLVVQVPGAMLNDQADLAAACAGSGIFLNANGSIQVIELTAESGIWRHQYANPQNLSDSQDERVG